MLNDSFVGDRGVVFDYCWVLKTITTMCIFVSGGVGSGKGCKSRMDSNKICWLFSSHHTSHSTQLMCWYKDNP